MGQNSPLDINLFIAAAATESWDMSNYLEFELDTFAVMEGVMSCCENSDVAPIAWFVLVLSVSANGKGNRTTVQLLASWHSCTPYSV